MGLSCECDEWDGDGIAWVVPVDFTTLQTKKSRRCKSCKSLIKPRSEALEFKRFHYPKDDIEERIYPYDDYEIPNASWFLCSLCGEIFLNLDDLNFCVRPDEDMGLLLSEYREHIIKDNGLFKGRNQ